MSNPPEYDFICSNNSIEMKLAKEYYHWDKLDKADSLNSTSTILEWLTLFPEDYNKLYKKYIDLSTDFCLLRLATKFPNERNILISYVSTCYTAIEWIYRFPEDKLKILNIIKEKSNMDYYSTVTHFDKFPY